MNSETLVLAGTLIIGVLAGGVAALKIIAPRTKNKVDDQVLARLEALQKLALQLLPNAKEEAKTPHAPGATIVRDKRA